MLFRSHGHVVTIVAKALNIDVDAYPRKANCSYFTNHAFVRGEVCDTAFNFIPARSRSCWRGFTPPSPIHEENVGEEEAPEPEEELPQYQPFGDVPLLTPPIQSAPGTSSDHPPIWDQILNNQLAMQEQMNAMYGEQKELKRRQRKMEYKLNQYFMRTGYSIESPPTTPSDD